MEGETPCARAPKDTEQVKVTATGDGWRAGHRAICQKAGEPGHVHVTLD